MGKKAPLWSIILAVILTVGSFTMATMALPALSDALQSQRDFSLTASPSSLSVNQGSTATAAIKVTSVNGFDLATGLTTSVSSTGNGWIIPTLANSILTPTSSAKASTTLSVTASQATPIGTYQIAISSSGGTKSHSTTVSVTVAPVDFTITPQPSSLTVAQNSYNATTLIIASQGGFSGNVSLTATEPLASMGVAGGPSPAHLDPGGAATSTLAIQASPLTPLGYYTVTITGTAGALIHMVNISVKVTNSTSGCAPYTCGIEALNLESSSFSNSTSATLYLRNTGTASISLVSYYVKDSAGNQYSLTTWAGPTISPNTVAAAYINIGASCSSCTLSGTAFTFTAGYSYTVTIVTSRNNQFTFTVVR